MDKTSSKTKSLINWIDEHTLLPISLVIIISGGVFWLANLSHSSHSSESKIESLKKQISEQNKDVNIKMDYIHSVMIDMNRSLGRIEGKVESKRDR